MKMSVTDEEVLRNYEDAPKTPPPELVRVVFRNFDDAPKAPPPEPVWALYAHDLYRKGFSVIPCWPQDKIIRGKGVLPKRRRWEPSRIERHAKSNPADNIGIHLDRRYSRLHLVVFDLDSKQALSGVEDLFDHEITPTYRVSTAKGHHLYYTTKQVYKSRTRLLPDLDLKATGIVMAPGSIHPSGFRYSVASDLPVATLPTSVENHLVEMGLLKTPPRSPYEIEKSAKRGKAMVLAPEGTRLVDPDSPKSLPTSHVLRPETPVTNPGAYIATIISTARIKYPDTKEGTRITQLNSYAYSIGRVIRPYR
jgi:hypothetical protein